MQKRFDRCSEAHRDEAISELRAELADFSHDGLVQLMEDLSKGSVVRGSWTGCVISYKRGAAGSAGRERRGIGGAAGQTGLHHALPAGARAGHDGDRGHGWATGRD